MHLRFETKIQDDSQVGVPILLNADDMRPDTVVDELKLDGAEVDLDERIMARFRDAVVKINTEVLLPKHFRDCSHFVMAMCGLWMPTHPPFDRATSMLLECEHSTGTKEHLGPTALGIPNDSRCLGFDNDLFVYNHSVFGVDSSMGILCFSKIGTNPEYSLSTYDTVLADYDLEVSHPITRLAIKAGGEEVFQWRSNVAHPAATP